MNCKHEDAERGERFDYCYDCGAVRAHNDGTGKPPDPWHVCERCVLKVATLAASASRPGCSTT